MPTCKRVPRAVLEVGLKRLGLAIIFEPKRHDAFPRGVLRGVFRSPPVVFIQSLLQVSGDTDIALFGERLRLKPIDLLHSVTRMARCSAPLGLRRVTQDNSAERKTTPAVSATQNGAEGARTPDLLHAMEALSQLSYGPLKGDSRKRFAFYRRAVRGQTPPNPHQP